MGGPPPEDLRYGVDDRRLREDPGQTSRFGHCARIAAGSVVIKPVPNNVTVARHSRQGRRQRLVARSRHAPWTRCSKTKLDGDSIGSAVIVVVTITCYFKI